MHLMIHCPHPLRRLAQALLACAATTLLGCGTVLPPEPLKHSASFEPVYPRLDTSAIVPTGAIFNGRQSESWFGKGRNYQVGDVITVLVQESSQASRTLNNDLSRESSNDVVPQGIQDIAAMGGTPFKGTNLLGGKISNKGTGTAGQIAKLETSVAVAVVDVMSNGNLVLRGEKQLGLTEGTEVIQVSGIIRPDDIAPNNTVYSKRLANAQIVYRGTGDLANATKAGWGTSGLLKIWPF
ncbi:MAG: flagellar basal body L-ring protein FlgH [Hylemonella sp.]|jgi:flagellar L-ring protein precursor FlgH